MEGVTTQRGRDVSRVNASEEYQVMRLEVAVTVIPILSILVLMTLVVDVTHWRWRGGRFTYFFTQTDQVRTVGIAVAALGVAIAVAAIMFLLRLINGNWFLIPALSWAIVQSAYSMLCRELEWRRGRGTVA